MRKYQILSFLSCIRVLFFGEPQLYRKYVALWESNRALSIALKEKLTAHIEQSDQPYFKKWFQEQQAHLDTMDILSVTYARLDESLARQQELLTELQAERKRHQAAEE